MKKPQKAKKQTSKTLRIGVSGSRGSFSEEAANFYAAKNKVKDYKIEYLVSVGNVLRALTEEKTDKGIFPIENSNGGVVLEAVYAMSQYIFNIENLFEVDIRHCLLVKPGTNATDIRKIVSHQQALRQCRMYLARKWGDLELVEYCDTAVAARDLSRDKLAKNCAVIAPKVCAKLYGLDILEEGIQDLKYNYTSFIVAVK